MEKMTMAIFLSRQKILLLEVLVHTGADFLGCFVGLFSFIFDSTEIF